MNKNIGSYLEDSNIKDINNLSKQEQAELLNYFKRTEQRNGGISFYDLVNILKNIGYQVNENKKTSLNKEIAQRQIKTIDLSILAWATSILKKEKEQSFNPSQTQESQYLDAFVALGGQIDKTGFVFKTTLMKTLKNEFELNFDIETLLEGLEGVDNEKLDFNQFCELFQQQKKTLGRKNSALSLLKNSDSLKSLVVDQKDFEKYLAKLEGHEIYSP